MNKPKSRIINDKKQSFVIIDSKNNIIVVPMKKDIGIIRQINDAFEEHIKGESNYEQQ